MTDAGFILAAYAVIVGGLVAYALSLRWRLRRARTALETRWRGPRAPS